MAISHLIYGLNLYILLNVMEDFGRDRNLERAVARNLVGIFAGGDLCARLGSSWITDGGMLSGGRDPPSYHRA